MGLMVTSIVKKYQEITHYGVKMEYRNLKRVTSEPIDVLVFYSMILGSARSVRDYAEVSEVSEAVSTGILMNIPSARDSFELFLHNNRCILNFFFSSIICTC